jgi:hypothetical protein
MIPFIIDGLILIIVGIVIRFTKDKIKTLMLVISAVIVGFLLFVYIYTIPELFGYKTLGEGSLFEIFYGYKTFSFLIKNRAENIITGVLLSLTFLFNMMAISFKGDGEKGLKVGTGLILIPFLLLGIFTSKYHIPHLLLILIPLIFLLFLERNDERGVEIGVKKSFLYKLLIVIAIFIVLSFTFRILSENALSENQILMKVFMIIAFIMDIFALITAVLIPVLSHWPGERIDHTPDPTFSYPVALLLSLLPLIVLFKWFRLYDVNMFALFIIGVFIISVVSLLSNNERNQFRTSLAVVLTYSGFIFIAFSTKSNLGYIGGIIIALNLLFFAPLQLYFTRRAFLCQRLMGGTGLEGVASGLPRAGVIGWWSIFGMGFIPPSIGSVGLLFTEIAVIQVYGIVAGIISIIPYILHLVILFEYSRRTLRGTKSFDEPDTEDFSLLESLSSILIGLFNFALFVVIILYSNLFIEQFL